MEEEQTQEEKPKKVYKCNCPRPDGTVCGYETTDENGVCPHDGIVVSSGKKFVVPKAENLCPTCKQPLPEQEVVFSPTATIDKTLPPKVEPPKQPEQPAGAELQKESEPRPGNDQSKVFK